MHSAIHADAYIISSGSFPCLHLVTAGMLADGLLSDGQEVVGVLLHMSIPHVSVWGLYGNFALCGDHFEHNPMPKAMGIVC